jgi:Na+-driven multidrug efflux pump
VTTTTAAATTPQAARKMPPVLPRLFSGTIWLALKTPLQAVFALWTVPLVLQAVGPDQLGAFGFAWGFGFFQFLLEFGMSSALQRQVSESWTQGDRQGVDRAVACGVNFYAAMALVQAAALLAVAYVALPYTSFRGESYRLVVKLLWLQALTAPCYGMSVVVSSVLQAARRYGFVPKLELVVVTARFAVLYAGVNAGVDFFTVVAAQTALQVTLTLGPALWVMTRELGHRPHFRGARRSDYAALLKISFYMFLVQLSVVLADKIDTTVLGFALADPGPALAAYQVVSKPFLQVRQTGWMLAYMVMPAVASLAAARDARGLDRIKYDGTRLHFAAVLPVALLAWSYAPPFLTLWVGDRLGYDAALEAPRLRLFLVAAIPLILSVPVQAAFGVNRPQVVALAALGGSLVNLPLSLFLTWKLQNVSGVIWGTVLTTLFSNLLIPGVSVFRALGIRLSEFARRTLVPPLAGGLALLLTAWWAQQFWPLRPDPSGGAGVSLMKWLPLVAHVLLGCAGYAAGYLATPAGRRDLAEISGKFLRRSA